MPREEPQRDRVTEPVEIIFPVNEEYFLADVKHLRFKRLDGLKSTCYPAFCDRNYTL